MTKEYREAFTEVNEILKYFNKDLLKKIPKEFIENIKENMSTTYKVIYDNTKSLNEQNIKQETRAILSIIYRDYICDKETKEKIIQKDRKEWLELEEKKKEEYKNTELFKSPIKNQNISNDKYLKVVEKQNIIIKIIEKIKEIWRKIRGYKSKI